MLKKENLLPLSGFEPTTILFVELRYNDRSISTRHFWTLEDKNNLMYIRETYDITFVRGF
jgi:hypothetical protein